MDTDDEGNLSDEYVYEDAESFDDEAYDDVAFSEEDTSLLKTSSNARTSSAKDKIAVPDGSYIITEYEAIVPLLESMVSEVSALLDVDKDAAQILLQQCRWSKEKLMDQYFASPDQLLISAGLNLFSSDICNPARKQEATPRSPSVSLSSGKNSSADDNGGPATSVVDGKFACRICCDDEADASDSFGLGCSHLFCRSCYSEYLRMQVADGPACILSHCPQHKCKQTATKSVFGMLVDEASLKRYMMYVTRNFIETSRNMKYCPSAGCEKVAVGSGVITIRCSCKNPFCFKCGEEAHEPVNCAQLAKWTEKCMNESETANWILANTKKCPRCSSRIEKNQGCNHMNCNICKHEFCWICMGPWVEHNASTGGYYKCNKYDVAKPDADASEAQKAKAELERYLHYYKRFHGHDQSLKFAAFQRENAEKRMVECQELNKSSWIDVQFLQQAAEQVIECRRVLKYTYVHGYFLLDNSQEKVLFEHHQEMLEKNTEKLHEYTEANVDTLDRTQVVNHTRVTERFMASLLASIAGCDDVIHEATAANNDSNNNNHGSSSSSNSSGGGSNAKASAVTPAASSSARGKNRGSSPAIPEQRAKSTRTSSSSRKS